MNPEQIAASRRTQPMLMMNARALFRVAPTRPPDAFLRVPRGTQARRGSASTAAMHRAKQLLTKLGL